MTFCFDYHNLQSQMVSHFNSAVLCCEELSPKMMVKDTMWLMQLQNMKWSHFLTTSHSVCIVVFWFISTWLMQGKHFGRIVCSKKHNWQYLRVEGCLVCSSLFLHLWHVLYWLLGHLQRVEWELGVTPIWWS